MFAGGLLGLSIALKLIAWPIVLYLVLRRKWKVVCSACCSAAMLNLVAAALIGFRGFAYYYTNVTRCVIELYRSDEFNFSSYALPWKLFAGTRSYVLRGFAAPPMLNAPLLALVLSFLLPLMLLSLGLLVALRARCFETSFGVLVCVAILINPVAWHHSLVLALIPLAMIARHFLEGTVTSGVNRPFVYSILFIFFPYDGFRRWILTFMKVYSPLIGVDQVSSAASLFVFIPAVCLVVFSWVLWKLDSGDRCRTCVN